jgi:hypothetical protein
MAGATIVPGHGAGGVSINPSASACFTTLIDHGRALTAIRAFRVFGC